MYELPSPTTVSSVIKTLGYKPVSPVSFLRAGIQNEEYSHVLSFRRQIFVTPDESINLPSSLVIQHDGTNYRIFLTYDDQTCFKCHLTGHIASQCTSQPQEITDANILNKPTPTITIVHDEVTSRNANAPTNETMETEHVPEKGRPTLKYPQTKNQVLPLSHLRLNIRSLAVKTVLLIEHLKRLEQVIPPRV
ncbi:hypothetical protein Zmor_017500 [Zophobas morio]|uniref:CCHC-type domain-containing protein n=1 Tax=Zophobas morio TaxID=2755281 RepID=A0AA38MCN2_9CUCU|nr:hypothetical protein Zmor_017500 [Zophobas morio]